VDRKYSMRDMQYVDLAKLAKDDMREAFSMSKTMLGVAESETNRATAEAAEYVFAKYNQVPRLERISRRSTPTCSPVRGDRPGVRLREPGPGGTPSSLAPGATPASPLRRR
jgi:hypothetical protein